MLKRLGLAMPILKHASTFHQDFYSLAFNIRPLPPRPPLKLAMHRTVYLLYHTKEVLIEIKSNSIAGC